MDPIDFQLPPGFLKRVGPRAATGRYIDGQWVRFVQGMPEKIGGWQKWSSAQLQGTVRGMHTWNDLTSRTVLAAGTNLKLYSFDVNKALLDITPYVDPAGVSVTSKLSTTNGSPTVTVSVTSHGLTVGQIVTVETAISVGGLSLLGDYNVQTVIDGNTFTITAGSNASSTVTNGGTGTMFFQINPGSINPSAGFGWGVGQWGKGTWGTARSSTTTLFEPSIWSLDHAGKLLLAAPFQGKLYSWDPTTLPVPRATIASANAPGAMRYMFVTPERFVFALGCSADTSTAIDNMLVRWPSQGTLDTWTPSNTNTANSRRLQNGRKIMGGGAVTSGISLVWTDTALYTFQYTGSRFVYDSRMAADKCGLVGPMAWCAVNGTAFWLSAQGLFMWNGGVDRIPGSDDIQQWVTDQLRLYYQVKAFAFYHAMFDELWFVWVPEGSSEPGGYAICQVGEWHWTTGTIDRTSVAIFDGADQRPIMAGTDGYLYVHETGLDADGGELPWRLQSGVFELASGGAEVDVGAFVPDFQRLAGTLSLTVSAQDRAMGGTIDTMTRTIAETDTLVDFRVSGREVQVIMEGSGIGNDFRLGKPQFHIQQVGGRP